jgi:hypothetical protein
MRTVRRHTNFLKVGELRIEFWNSHPEFKSEYRTAKKHNDYNATIQFAFSVFVDHMKREGKITDVIANKATL